MKTSTTKYLLLRSSMALAVMTTILTPISAWSAEHAEGNMMEKCEEMKKEKQKMQAEMKAQDDALTAAVGTMNNAAQEKKLDLAAGVVTQLVEQRAAMNTKKAEMQEKMMKHMMGHMEMGKESMSQCPMMKQMSEKSDGDSHDHAGAADHEGPADHILGGYTLIADALFKDDLAAAQKAAADMIKQDKDSAMANHAQAIADSKSLADARKHFDALSKIAIQLAKKEKVMHVAHCPMALSGKGADWLQEKNDEIKNPYMGQKMPNCGEFTK